MAAIATLSAVMAVTAAAVTWPAATIEAAASTATAIGTSAAIPTIAAASTIPAASAAAEGPLEARTRAAADTGRVTRLKFFARGATGARRTRFAGEKNFVFRGAGCRDLLRFVFELTVLVFVMLVGFIFVMMFGFAVFPMLVVLFVRRLVVFEIDVVAESGDMQRVFVRGIGFRFRDGLRRAHRSAGFGFVRLVLSRLVFLVVFARFLLFVVFRLFFVDFGFFFEDRSAGDSIGLHDFTDFVLLRIDQAGRKSGALVVTELGTVAVFRFFGSVLSIFHRFDFLFIEFGNVLRFGIGLFADDFRGLRASACEEPAGKGSTGTAWAGRCAGNHGAAPRLNVF